ncbi:hypothetical protein AJ80_03847 [Polytolypa hystricis UAMH7299]|uniref:Uncharacterized protein n=1 Tax=Polytolypa hystricis (strain UAMH7299) TaxID=1447883 RepID=A0A2B7YFN1_POLH7|nr:hypothetical protein AJ80_03847 [Polytolypa hystricis UAMH7299]
MPSLAVLIAVSVASSLTLSLLTACFTITWLRSRYKTASPGANCAGIDRCENGEVVFGADGCGSTRPNATLPYASPRQWAAIGSSDNVSTHAGGFSIDRPPPRNGSKRRSSFFDSLSNQNGRKLQKRPSCRDIPLDRMTSPTTPPSPSQAEHGYVEPFLSHDHRGLQTEVTPIEIFQGQGETGDAQNPKGRASNSRWSVSVSSTIRRLPDMAPCDAVNNDDGSAPGATVTRRTSGTMLNQTAGSPPKQPVPPLPPTSRPRSSHLPRRDSFKELSSMSLETANSSILNHDMGSDLQNTQERRDLPNPPMKYSNDSFHHTGPTPLWYARLSGSHDIEMQNRVQSQRDLGYRPASAGSYRHSRETVVPRRSFSTPYPDGSPLSRSSMIPTTRNITFNAPDTSHPLQNKQWQQMEGNNSRRSSLSQDHFVRPPPRYELNKHIVARRASNTSLNERAVLRPTTGNVRNVDFSRQTTSSTYTPPKQYNGLQSNSRNQSPVSNHKGHRRQNCVRIPVFAPRPSSILLTPTVELPEEPLELPSNELHKADKGSMLQNGHTHNMASGMTVLTHGSSPPLAVQKPFHPKSPFQYPVPRRSALRNVSSRAAVASPRLTNTNDSANQRSASAPGNQEPTLTRTITVTRLSRPASPGSVTIEPNNQKVTALANGITPRADTTASESTKSTIQIVAPSPDSLTPTPKTLKGSDIIGCTAKRMSLVGKANDAGTSTVTPSKENWTPLARTPGSIYDQYGFLKE